MSISPEKIADLRLKQLEMLQSIIGRMASYGPTHRNYCITLTTAICGAAATLERPLVSLLSFFSIFVFWLLDTQYLRTEKCFRHIFARCAQENWSSIPHFEFRPNQDEKVEFWGVFFSWSLAIFYMPLMVGVVTILFAMRIIYGRFI
jgi:hypothetical protein